MRNLKRALSLALASVMLLGMMVVGTSAASYPDIDENDNVEAIEVLNAVKVMIGDRGNFRPDAAVNRHEMATIMAKLVLGVETADNYVGTHPFTDVFPWADKYVAACYENGLVAGTSATTFGGNQPLTAVQAAAMMLRALGYKDLSKGATDWRAPVTAMANQIRLFSGVASNPSEQLNRNQVAQLALNTLKSHMVNLKDNTISWTDGEGQIIMTGGSRDYIALSSHESYAKAINDTERAGTSASGVQGYTVELGEHLYNGKLKLDNNYLDVFGRPARHWEFDGKEIGSYIKEELMVKEYSDDEGQSKVTGNDLYTLLGASTIKEYGVNVAIDGIDLEDNDAKAILGDAYFDRTDMDRNNKKEVGDTGTGTLTQVFVDHEKDQVYVAVINTYLARAARDYDEKAEEATLTVYGIDEYRTSDKYFKDLDNKADETMKVQDEDFTLVKDIKKDDPYLVTVADGEIQTMVPAEVLEAVNLTAFKKGAHVVSDGTTYKYTTTATYNQGDLDAYTTTDNTNLKDITYNIYLDAYGNLIGIKEIDAVKNYVFLAGIDLDGSNLYNKNATANALFLDGTSKTITINMAKSKWTAHPGLNNTNVVIEGDALLNTWCTYTVNSDGVYTVTEVYATSMNPNETDPNNTSFSPNNYPQPNATGTVPNKTKLAQSWQRTTNTGKVEVKNLRLSGGGTGTFANVYGDSTSVYLTAKLDELSDRGNANGSWGIIKDVDSVSTGIADTSINVWKDTEARNKADGTVIKQTVPLDQVAYGIYTLYDSDGIVIAAVVVGENDGVKDLVYVHSGGLDLESYDSTKDEWTWTRKVIFNGEEITLTEKGDSLSELEDMDRYQWYEIKRNANGEIIDATEAWKALEPYRVDMVTDPATDFVDVYGIYDTTGYFVDRYYDINKRVETANEDTILYQTDGGPVDYANDPVCHAHKGLDDDLIVIGSNTLAVQTETGSGIHFRDNVNVVWQYYNQNTKQVEIETGTGLEAVKDMVDFVNKNNDTDRMNGGVKQYYYLSALIEKNFATTIVVYDEYNNYEKGEPELTGTHLKGNATIESVNKALLEGNVIIDETWRPADLVKDNAVNTNVVKIPSNRTLMIDGDFIAYENRGANSGSIYIESGNGSKLIVNGDFDMADQTLSCNTEVNHSTRYSNEGGNMTINLRPELGRYVELYAKLDVAEDLKVKVDPAITNPIVRVNTGAYVDVDGQLTADTTGVVFTIYGHLAIGNDSYNGTTTFPIHYDVLSDSTLEAGTLYGTFCVGGGSRTGRVEVGTLLTTAATGNHSGATLNKGSLVINGANYTTAFNIGDNANARIVFGSKATDEVGVFQTDTGDQAKVAGKTYVFIEKDGVIKVTDENKNDIYTDTDGDGVVDKVVDKDADEGGSITPPEGQPIKTVTVTGLPTGTIKAGDKFTVKSSTKDVTGEVNVTAEAPKTTINLTVTTTHKDGFASDVSISGWTLVEVSADGKTAKFTKTVDVESSGGTTGPIEVKVTGDAAPDYVFEITYTGAKPTDKASVIAKINEALASETEVATFYTDSNAVYGTVDGVADQKIGTITWVGTFSLYVNGNKIDGITLTNAATAKDETATLPDNVASMLITDGEANVASGDGFAVTNDMGTMKVTITAAKQKALSGDLKLVNGYKLATQDSSIASTQFMKDGVATAATAGNFFPDSTKFVFTGTKTKDNGSNVTLTVGTKEIATKEAGATATKWEVTFDAKTMLDANKEILAKESVSSVLTLKIGSDEWTIKSATAITNNFVVAPTAKMPTAGTYIAQKADGSWDTAAANPWTAAADSGNPDAVKFTNSGAANIVNNTLTLKPAVKVTVTTAGTKIKFDAGSSITTQGASEVHYAEPGAMITVEGASSAATDRLVVKCGSETLATVVGQYPKWAIPTNLTEAQKTAGLVIDVEKAVGALVLAAPSDNSNVTTIASDMVGTGSTMTGVKAGTASAVAGEGTRVFVLTLEADTGYYFADKTATPTAVAAASGKFAVSNISSEVKDGKLVVTFTLAENAEA